jgi:DNA-binding MarR family transcriptional regulator
VGAYGDPVPGRTDGGQPGRPPGWVTADPAGIPAHVLARAGAAMNAVFARELATVGLRPHTFLVLAHLARDSMLTSAELARRLAVTPQSMSTLLHGLLDAGWVDRTPDARRGQRVDVRITDRGRAALEAAGPVLAELGRPEALGLTAAEAATLHALLTRVLATLTDPGPAGAAERTRP